METRSLGVKVTYRNRDLEQVYTKTYSLSEYTEMLHADLLRLVTDIEDLCYTVNNGKPKEEWSDETFAAFNKIKHKLLDKAGDIGRMPENLVERVSIPMNEAIRSLIEGGDAKYGESRLGPRG
jgi:hypothetical protein